MANMDLAAPIRASAAVSVEQPAAWKKAASATFSVLGTLLTALLVIVAALAIVISVASRLARNDQYTVFGHPVLVMLSGSMTPVINTGDLIVDDRVTRTQAQNLHVGQVITFYDGPGHGALVVTHRIVKVVHQGGKVSYMTKGDANQSADLSLRPAASVIGVYKGKVPFGGYVLSDLHKPLVLGLLLAAPIMWLVSGWLWDWAKREEAPARPKDPTAAATEGDGI